MFAVNLFLSHAASCSVSAITSERLYIAPHPALQTCISHYTIYAPQGKSSGTLTIVPDASGSLVCRLAEEPGSRRAETCFWGPSSCAVTVESNPGKYPLYMMVEFLPCGAGRLFRMPMHQMHNRILPLETADATLHRVLMECMEYLITDPVSGVPRVCALLNAAFLRRLAQGEGCFAQQVVGELQRSSGTLRVGELSRRLGCSPRQLARIMGERLGMPAKSLARIIRINAACRHMDSLAVPLTQLAHSLQYHDQSHFIHDFTDICGVTPGEYLSHLSHFYNEDLKLGGMLPQK